MGLFSSKKAPRITIPEAPKFKQAGEVFQNALNFNRDLNPLALGAREGALQDISKGTNSCFKYSPTNSPLSKTKEELYISPFL